MPVIRHPVCTHNGRRGLSVRHLVEQDNIHEADLTLVANRMRCRLNNAMSLQVRDAQSSQLSTSYSLLSTVISVLINSDHCALSVKKM